MKKVKIVIGANFGDEGKGLATDYFCSRMPADKRVLNVRFNGGAQAGHTVVTPEGKRHVFSHFGAGSFLPNVATYLGPQFIVNPILFRREWEALRSLGIWPMVYVHPWCLITMPQDMMLNQELEKFRGDGKHGSCGIGIYETLTRDYQSHVMSIIRMINDGYVNLDYYDKERFEKIIGIPLPKETKKRMVDQNIMAHYQEDVRFLMSHVNVVGCGIFSEFDYVVFEGAQGLGLDQNNMDFFPHLTPSNTGIKNVVDFLRSDMDIEICYVTRPYLTRHGAGKLPGECPREMVGAGVDLTNHENEWQGSLRYGKIDYEDVIRRCTEDSQKLSFGAKVSFMITHLDETIEEVDSKFIRPSFGVYASHGPTRKDVRTILGGFYQNV